MFLSLLCAVVFLFTSVVNQSRFFKNEKTIFFLLFLFPLFLFLFFFSSSPGFQLFAFTRGGVVIVTDDSISAWTIHVAGLQG